MQFRLVYDGPLPPSGNDNKRPKAKHDVRQQFHPQLKRLWEITPFLKLRRKEVPIKERHHWVYQGDYAAILAQQNNRCQYGFVPLVTKDLSLACALDILFLRRDGPGSLIEAGDIDGRLKTLFDALQIPDSCKDVGPHPDQNEFYCLLENDKLITKVTVDTDTLLIPEEIRKIPDSDTDETVTTLKHVHLIIGVKIIVTDSSWANLDFIA